MPGTDSPDLSTPTHVPPSREPGRARLDPAALRRLLGAWMQGDPAEQRETFEFLRRSLDEDRPAGYKLFS